MYLYCTASLAVGTGFEFPSKLNFESLFLMHTSNEIGDMAFIFSN